MKIWFRQIGRRVKGQYWMHEWEDESMIYGGDDGEKAKFREGRLRRLSG
jgi:hypothetical protein